MNLFSSAKITHNEVKKVKANPPLTFNPPDDIRLWILKVNDYFTLQKITDLSAQAAVTCSYLGDTLHWHTQRLRLTEDVEPFSTWLKLQSWLLANYSLPDADLKADLAMNKLQMRHKETVQSFINWFETIIAELKWNESAVTAAFRRKLNNEITEMIHFLQSAGWPKTFTEFKQVAQQAENHLHISKRQHEERLNEPPPKWLRFNLLSNRNERRQDEWEAHKPSPFWERAVNLRMTASNSLPISEEVRARSKEKRHRREQRHCLNCGGPDHWADKCTSSCNLLSGAFTSKNA